MTSSPNAQIGKIHHTKSPHLTHNPRNEERRLITPSTPFFPDFQNLKNIKIHLERTGLETLGNMVLPIKGIDSQGNLIYESMNTEKTLLNGKTLGISKEIVFSNGGLYYNGDDTNTGVKITFEQKTPVDRIPNGIRKPIEAVIRFF